MLSDQSGVGLLSNAMALPAGSAVAMAGAAQDYWEHALPLDREAAPARVSASVHSSAARPQPGVRERARRSSAGHVHAVPTERAAGAHLPRA